jgi:hypothetical protein
MKSLLETITKTREHLDKELQVETWTTNTLIEGTQREFHTQLKEVKAWAGMEEEWKHKFGGTTSWAMFRHQFGIVADHNCWMSLEKSTY